MSLASEQLKVRVLVKTIAVLACAIVVFSLIFLFVPLGLFGIKSANAETSSAISASIAIVVAVIAFVVSVIMQSPGYRIELEIVEDLRRMQNLLYLLATRVGFAMSSNGGVWQAVREAERAGLAEQASQLRSRAMVAELDDEEAKLLREIFVGAAGRFLVTLATEKSMAATDAEVREEPWRVLVLDISKVLHHRSNLEPAITEIMRLLQLLGEVDEETLRRVSRRTSAIASLRESGSMIADTPMVAGMAGMIAKRQQVSNADIGQVISQATSFKAQGLLDQVLALARERGGDGLVGELQSSFKAAIELGSPDDWALFQGVVKVLRSEAADAGKGSAKP